jgi:hypothetical protein
VAKIRKLLILLSFLFLKEKLFKNIERYKEEKKEKSQKGFFMLTNLTIQKDSPMSTTTSLNQKKDLPMIDFNYSELAKKTDLFLSSDTDADIENLQKHYNTLVNCNSEENFNALLSAFEKSKLEYCSVAEERISELESEISHLEEIESAFNELQESCYSSYAKSYLHSVIRELESAFREVSDSRDDLESEKENLDEFVEFYTDTEILLDELKEKREKPIIVARTFTVGKHDSDHDDDGDEIEAMTADEHRITWEGANAQDIANLVSKILTNKELATHLVLEAFKAERNFSQELLNSCPNGHFSK